MLYEHGIGGAAKEASALADDLRHGGADELLHGVIDIERTLGDNAAGAGALTRRIRELGADGEAG